MQLLKGQPKILRRSQRPLHEQLMQELVQFLWYLVQVLLNELQKLQWIILLSANLPHVLFRERMHCLNALLMVKLEDIVRFLVWHMDVLRLLRQKLRFRPAHL